MRLVCPNCDAEYEVDASVIPETGRDVQCSNCGSAWFQMSPQVEEELAAEEALFEAPIAEPPASPAYDPAGDEDDDQADDRPEHLAAAPPHRNLDDSVLSVLREEAERETNARRAEAPLIETQADLGLTAGRASSTNYAEDDPVAQRIAKIKGIDPTPPPAKPQSRRDMLPEIDEINSTLRASNAKREGDAGAVMDSLQGSPRPAGFRNGFLVMMILAVVIVALYVMAPKLAQQIPGLAPALNAYVAMVDSARMALDGLLRSAIGLMRG